MKADYHSYEMTPIEIGLDILGKLQAEFNPTTIKQSVTDKTRDLLKNFQIGTPALSDVLKDLGDLPPFSVVIGLAEDGLPVLFNLDNPDTGALLVAGDPESGKTSLLQTLIKSACTTNSPRNLRFCCISTKPEEFYGHKSLPHCFKVQSTYSDESFETIENLVEVAEQRKYGRFGGEAVLLVIDDLPGIVEQLGQEGLDLLKWLVEHGPYSKVWTIASLDSSQSGRIPGGLIDSFPTWILGRIDVGKVGSNLAKDRIRPAAGLIPGAQFCTYSEEWIRFWNMRM